MKTLKRLFAVLSTIWKLLGFIGWQSLFVSLGLSCLAWFWARLQDIPVSIAVMVTMPFFVSILYLFKLPAFIIGTTEIEMLRRPDYKLWAALDRYNMGDVSCLMAGVHPVNGPGFITGNAIPFYQLLYQAIHTKALAAHTAQLTSGQLDPLNDQGQPPNWATVIMRKDLQAFCASQKSFAMPRFLKD